MSYTSLEYAGAAVLVVAFVPGVMKSATICIQIALAAHTHIHKLKTVLCRRVCVCFARACLIIKINACAPCLKCNLPPACLYTSGRELNKIFK